MATRIGKTILPQADRKPNWRVWANVPDVRVWEAVALSLGVDPKKVETMRNAWMGGSNSFPHVEGQEFEDRIEVLRRNLGDENGLPLSSIIMNRPDYCQITLADFVVWALRLGWEMPPELRALASRASSAAPYEKPPTAAERPAEVAKVEVALVVPEKLTLAWMWDHVPVSWWWWLAGLIAAACVVGVTVGKSELYARLVSHAAVPELKRQAMPDARPATSPPPAKSAGAGTK